MVSTRTHLQASRSRHVYTSKRRWVILSESFHEALKNIFAKTLGFAGFSPDSTLSTDPWPSTWSITSLGRIKDWLASCLADHSDCRQASQLLRAHVSQPEGYPSRLIDVDPDLSLSSLPPGTRDSLDTRYSVRDNPWVCIRNTRQLPSQQAPYATLSHRWSGSPSLLLTKANATVLSHAIPREALLAPDSQAIAEAIEVTRALGIPYLWVDSLCITQDDGPEKQAEIARMDKVYLGSHLNISATASSSGSGGLFRSRNPSSVNPLVRTYDVPQAHRRELTGTFVIHVDRWTKSVANAPLNNRGWVFQERALAPRIIHFAHDQVYWECYAGGISECFASPEASDSGTFKSDIVSLNRQNWYKIVNASSPTAVTFAEDKLTAMSAVARVAGGLLGYADGDYLAGLWRPELVPTLYWNAWHPSPRRAASYRAPSWSWASMDTRCMMTDGSLRLQPAVEVVDVDLQMKRGYRYGEASSGYLLVKGSVWKGRSLVASREEGALISSPLGLGEDIQVINFFRSSPYHMHRRYETRRTGLTLIIRWDDAELDSFVGDVFFLALSTRLPENGRAMVDYSMCA